MRINSGIYKGRRLLSPNDRVRPMRSSLRESLFNIIPCEGKFMDVFSGTGAVGIEALSRGFDFTRFVELNGRNVSDIKKNLINIDVPKDDYIVNKGNVLYIFKDIQESPDYDVIFCGTPYIESMYPKVFALGFEKLLKPNSLLIIQTERYFKPPEPWETRIYGKDALHFFENKNL